MDVFLCRNFQEFHRLKPVWYTFILQSPPQIWLLSPLHFQSHPPWSSQYSPDDGGLHRCRLYYFNIERTEIGATWRWYVAAEALGSILDPCEQVAVVCLLATSDAVAWCVRVCLPEVFWKQTWLPVFHTPAIPWYWTWAKYWWFDVWWEATLLDAESWS